MTKVAALAWIIPLFILFIVLAHQGNNLMPPTPAPDKNWARMNVIVVIDLLLSLFPIFSGLRAWTRTGLRPITRVKFTLVALSFLFFSYVALHYHLIGPVRL